ncbi:MAG: ComF family protein [Caldilineaceae bacterium]|nr:ComF family protein [Caldilineaceae bacterium]
MISLARLGNQLLDLFFPPRCAGCARAGFVFCPQCAQDVLPVVAPFCEHCGRPQVRPTAYCAACRGGDKDALALVRVATVYTEPVRSAIRGLKYGAQPELAPLLARYLIAAAQQPPWPDILPMLDGVVPVPLHAKRLADRRYNQSGLLGRAFVEHFGLPLADSWLHRSRQTQSQVGLSAVERRQNVADAFQAGGEVAGKRLLLVDDVFTTGATLTACAQALKLAGAVEVYGLVLATPAPSGGTLPDDV